MTKQVAIGRVTGTYGGNAVGLDITVDLKKPASSHNALVEALENSIPLMVVCVHEAQKRIDPELVSRLTQSIEQSRAALEAAKG